MTNLDDLRRLHFIDALFADLTGHDLYLAQQITAAITTSLTEVEGRPPADPAFTAAAARLLDRLSGGRQDYGFFHWDAAESPAAATPLFARVNVLTGLRRLAGFRESTLLVTNLRPAHCPPRRRWTERRRHEYQESLGLIRDLATARCRRSASLNLFFL
ncbi:MAG: hypothetical protein A3G75_01540 [Verrucomicrobia bacterium RIFCSPLOWO2_12_FULL_64_8]|nr:MAG: hypothetical protein A3G75_01540 [Verrucomicrobia bacterium RIFCSPLOWO2_12_FULL_64_8]